MTVRAIGHVQIIIVIIIRKGTPNPASSIASEINIELGNMRNRLILGERLYDWLREGAGIHYTSLVAVMYLQLYSLSLLR